SYTAGATRSDPPKKIEADLQGSVVAGPGDDSLDSLQERIELLTDLGEALFVRSKGNGDAVLVTLGSSHELRLKDGLEQVLMNPCQRVVASEVNPALEKSLDGEAVFAELDVLQL